MYFGEYKYIYIKKYWIDKYLYVVWTSEQCFPRVTNRSEVG